MHFCCCWTSSRYCVDLIGWTTHPGLHTLLTVSIQMNERQSIQEKMESFNAFLVRQKFNLRVSRAEDVELQCFYNVLSSF